MISALRRGEYDSQSFSDAINTLIGNETPVDELKEILTVGEELGFKVNIVSILPKVYTPYFTSLATLVTVNGSSLQDTFSIADNVYPFLMAIVCARINSFTNTYSTVWELRRSSDYKYVREVGYDLNIYLLSKRCNEQGQALLKALADENNHKILSGIKKGSYSDESFTEDLRELVSGDCDLDELEFILEAGVNGGVCEDTIGLMRSVRSYEVYAALISALDMSNEDIYSLIDEVRLLEAWNYGTLMIDYLIKGGVDPSRLITVWIIATEHYRRPIGAESVTYTRHVLNNYSLDVDKLRAEGNPTIIAVLDLADDV